MNIFILSDDPIEAATMLCDKHVPKMIVESAQMLSTAHRVLDGNQTKGLSKSGKRLVKKWIHPNIALENTLYKCVHVSHPCTVWTMLSSANYKWHYDHFVAMCDEYTFRYGKIHSTEKLLKDVLKQVPQNIKIGQLTNFALAMKANPECIIEDDAVLSYRAYYKTKQDRFVMRWTKRNVPEWFTN